MGLEEGAAEAILRFQVQGSARVPYVVTFDGSGSSLRAFCTCPAGGRGGRFCKHVAALLVGDVTALVCGETRAVEALKARAHGSRLVAQAVVHQGKPAPPTMTGVACLEDVRAACADQIARLGLEAVLEGDPAEAQWLGLHRRGKSGRLLKEPAAALAYERVAFELVALPDGTWVEEARGLRERPWIVRLRSGTTTYRTLERAAGVFRAGLEAMG